MSVKLINSRLKFKASLHEIFLYTQNIGTAENLRRNAIISITWICSLFAPMVKGSEENACSLL